MTAWLLVLLLAAPARPDARLTPGAVRGLSLQTICSTRWGIDRRHITVGMKRRVAAAYGVAWSARGQYEFDHLIPRSLGGADVEANLWPQPLADARHRKDPLEVRLGKLVCARQVDLGEAQQALARDWVTADARWAR